MSQRNVDLVRMLQPQPDDDLVKRFADDEWVTGAIEAAAALVHDDFECVIVWPGRTQAHTGFDGLRRGYGPSGRGGWLAWSSMRAARSC